MTQPKWKRGDLVRTTAQLMFAKVVIPEGTQIRILGHEVFSSEELAYDGMAFKRIDQHGRDVTSLPGLWSESDITVDWNACYPLWAEDLEDVT